MTTLYRPVLIESAEQAEALPLSTRAIRPDGQAAARLDGVSEGGQWTSKLRLYAHDEVIGWTALVPIEAEEEHDDYGEYEPAGYVIYERTRFVTEWEDVIPEEEA